MVNQGRLGLGCITRSSRKDAKPKEQWGTVQKEIQVAEKEDRQTRVVAKRQQGS